MRAKKKQVKIAPGCGHLKTDHEKAGPKPPHQDTETRTGDPTPRMYPTSNEGAYCKLALCSCLDFKGKGKICK